MRVVLMPERAERYLEKLHTEKEHIEAQIGAPLVWNPHPEKRVKTIKLERSGSVLVRDAWPPLPNGS